MNHDYNRGIYRRKPDIYDNVIIIIYLYRKAVPAMLESHRPCGHKKNTSEKTVYSSDFFQSLNHSTISQKLNIGLNSFL